MRIYFEIKYMGNFTSTVEGQNFKTAQNGFSLYLQEKLWFLMVEYHGKSYGLFKK